MIWSPSKPGMLIYGGWLPQLIPLSALSRPSLLAIAQRVSVRYHLPYFEPDETAQYISHHLKVTGVSATLFTEEAVRVIHEATQGAARAIGSLCNCCLLHAIYTLPISMERSGTWYMIDKACNIPFRRCMPRQSVLTPGIPSCLRPR